MTAGALAAVSAAVVASFFGVAGTVIGAAVASVISTVGAAAYTESMRRTHAGLRRADSRLVRSPQSPEDRSASNRPPLPAPLDPRRPPPRRRWPRWAMVAVTAVAVFGLAMVVVTTVELIGHKPVAALVGGCDRTGGTTLGSLTGATGGDSRQQPAPASPSATPTTPTDGNAPASDSRRHRRPAVRPQGHLAPSRGLPQRAPPQRQTTRRPRRRSSRWRNCPPPQLPSGQRPPHPRPSRMPSPDSLRPARIPAPDRPGPINVVQHVS